MSRLLVFLMGFLALVEIASAGTAEDYNEFVQFEVKFSKVYSSQSERSHRFGVFQDNLREIAVHNGNPNVSYRKGINQFSDLTAEEFKANHLGGYIKTAAGQGSFSGGLNSLPVLTTSLSPKDILKGLPQNVDWREHGIISPVKHQDDCGACWAFATIEQIESYLALATGNLTTLSVEELVACMPNVLGCGGFGGCRGGTSEIAYNWIQAYGLVSDSTIPYVSGNNGGWAAKCTLDVNNMERIAFIRGYETLMHNDMMATVNHLAKVGPLSVALDATLFQSYKEGIFDGCPYDKNININHGVQLVGYGSNDIDGHYWIVRNSWGLDFGENGYIRVKMDLGSDPPCGIDSTPSIGVACKGDGFNKQKVCGRCGILFAPSYPIGAMSSAHILP